MSLLTVCVLVLFFGGSGAFHAQQSAAVSKEVDLPARRLENVRIEAQGIGQFFADLSLSHDIPIGLEIAGDDDESAAFNIDFKKGTLADLLTQFVARHPQYTWEIRVGVVNIFPGDDYREVVLDELLRAEIGGFSVEEKTSCWALEESLVNTPEIKRITATHGLTHRGRNFTGVYIPQLGRHFTLDVSNMTLKSILNKVVLESPVAKIWLIKKYGPQQKFLISLNARHEELPMSDVKFDASQEQVH